jgi:hypothetical protein
LCALFASGVALTACQRNDQGTASPAVKASEVGEASRPSALASAPSAGASVAAVLTARCQTALQVLSTCAFETACNADMTMYLPSAARDQLVTLTKSPGFKAGAFDKYCVSTCNAKSPQVDQAAFAREVCGDVAGGVPAAVAAGPSATKAATDQIAFSVQGQSALNAEPVTLAVVLKQFGQPLKTTTSKHQCDSAFESEGTKEYAFATAGFETDGKTAVLRWLKIGAGTQVSLPGWPAGQTITMDGLKTLPGFTSLQVDDQTVRVGLAPGAGLETAYDFKFVNGQDRKSTRLNSSHRLTSRMPSSA